MLVIPLYAAYIVQSLDLSYLLPYYNLSLYIFPQLQKGLFVVLWLLPLIL
jgi:hypothetical protein